MDSFRQKHEKGRGNSGNGGNGGIGGNGGNTVELVGTVVTRWNWWEHVGIGFGCDRTGGKVRM